jgi:hypothetical protein
MSPTAGIAGPGGPDESQAAIERFLKASRQPILLEPGEEHFPLVPGRYSLYRDGVRLMLHAWDEQRNLVRRVTGLKAEQTGRLELVVEKFPRRTGKVLLIDLARPAAANVATREKRLSFREQFRSLLSRQFPLWKIAELSSELDLEHSLSARYPRALLKRGLSGLAAIGVPPHGAGADGALTFGLIWLDHLRHRARNLAVEGLVLFIPQSQERTTCLRLRWLNPSLAQWQVYVYAPEGYAAQADLNDYGNVDTRLEPYSDFRAGLSGQVLQWVERIAASPAVDLTGKRDGGVSLCVHGLEFARAKGDRLEFGLTQKVMAREPNLTEIESIARELARLRSPDAADQENALYRMQPECWLESQLRAHLGDIDASLEPAPLYDQVPAFAGGERGVLDLVAAERTGRLAVLELKTSEDVQLPLQALDYWLRVQWHLERGEFSERGYFPGISLVRQPPRLLLFAPALDFHPTTETILRYFSPAIPVERIGLAVEWRRKLKVIFRVLGSASPR